jgi:hypothetical protein
MHHAAVAPAAAVAAAVKPDGCAAASGGIMHNMKDQVVDMLVDDIIDQLLLHKVVSSRTAAVAAAGEAGDTVFGAARHSSAIMASTAAAGPRCAVHLQDDLIPELVTQSQLAALSERMADELSSAAGPCTVDVSPEPDNARVHAAPQPASASVPGSVANTGGEVVHEAADEAALSPQAEQPCFGVTNRMNPANSITNCSSAQVPISTTLSRSGCQDGQLLQAMASILMTAGGFVTASQRVEHLSHVPEGASFDASQAPGAGLIMHAYQQKRKSRRHMTDSTNVFGMLPGLYVAAPKQTAQTSSNSSPGGLSTSSRHSGIADSDRCNSTMSIGIQYVASVPLQQDACTSPFEPATCAESDVAQRNADVCHLDPLQHSACHQDPLQHSALAEDRPSNIIRAGQTNLFDTSGCVGGAAPADHASSWHQLPPVVSTQLAPPSPLAAAAAAAAAAITPLLPGGGSTSASNAAPSPNKTTAGHWQQVPAYMWIPLLAVTPQLQLQHATQAADMPITSSLTVTFAEHAEHELAADRGAVDPALQERRLATQQQHSQQEAQLLGDHSIVADGHDDRMHTTEDAEGQNTRQTSKLAENIVLEEGLSTFAHQDLGEDAILVPRPGRTTIR